MKSLHREDLYSWSEFNEEKNIDFNSFLWVSKYGNIAFDPLPVSTHDLKHIETLGGISWIIITNSDHIRDVENIRAITGAKVAGPLAEKDNLAIKCDRYLSTGDDLISGLKTIELQGSKTPGELSFILDDTTLITADLIRAHKANELMLLPKEKLNDYEKAKESIAKLLEFKEIETILMGDGWHIFEGATKKLAKFYQQLA
ncbi:MAG: MBL fold metallo-hydrolase [Halobacteriovoraceae bacterium]|jgi:hypothetical protein|nr:MBL fold metallo-hydrolase [Halobacteriovoraceae bacterium]